MTGIDRREGEFAAFKVALVTLFTLHPNPRKLADGLAIARQLQSDQGLFSTMSDDALQACDALLGLLTKTARDSA